MRMLGIQFSVNTRSIDLYLAGCKADPHCKGCHNPKSWDFKSGVPLTHKYLQHNIKLKLEKFPIIKRISILGGEPLDQDRDSFIRFLDYLQECNKELWLYTRYDFTELPPFVFKYFDFIKCGRYEESKKVDYHIQYGIELATSNQSIYKRGKDYE